MNPPAISNPAETLVGHAIADGWVIDRMLPKPGSIGAEELSGGFFSVGYIAKKGKKEAFFKAIDVQKALILTSGTLIERLKMVTDSHTFECSVLDVCKRAKLDKIVNILLKGEIPPPPGSMISIPYIMFEMADGDVRKIVSRSNRIDDAWRFRVLHDVAIGLQQLHGQQIAHQDLKPSNVLIFDQDGKGAKIGDLGCASILGQSGTRDNCQIPGAVTYAPPEQIFGVVPERWEERRESCDLYHLGSLAAFLFSGLLPTTHYQQTITKEIRPKHWKGDGKCDYKTALPLLTAEFTAYVQKIQVDFPSWATDELSEIIIHSCDPDFLKRGDPGSKAKAGNRIGIETFVSKFDRLAKRAEIEIRR